MDTSPSNDIDDRKIGARKGGIAICFHPKLQPSIHDKGSMASNKVQWIRFKGLERGHLIILNIYASNMANERCATWDKIFQILLV